MWKVAKVMGKITLEYLSMSLARIPMMLSGGAWSNCFWISWCTLFGCWCWWKMPTSLQTTPWKGGKGPWILQSTLSQNAFLMYSRLVFFFWGTSRLRGLSGSTYIKKTGCNAVDQKFNNYAFLFLSPSADLGIGLVWHNLSIPTGPTFWSDCWNPLQTELN